MSVFIGVPTSRAFETEWVYSLAATDMAGSYFMVSPRGLPPDIARNELIKAFKKTDHEFLLLADSDATWHPEAIKRLESRNLPFVSSIFFKRDIPPVPTIGIDAGISPTSDHLYDFGYTIKHIVEYCQKRKVSEQIENEQCFESSDDDLIPIDGSGAHFIMVRRDVIEAIPEPWFRCTKQLAGEDFDFSRKVKAAGFPMYADLSVYSGHIVGPGVNFGLRQFLMFYHWTKELKESQIWSV